MAHATVDAEDALPATHAVHEAPPVLFKVSVTNPALQLKHLPMALCSVADVAPSFRYFPARQSVHTFAVLALHFPATQIAHAIVDAEEAFPALHAVH